MLDLSNIWHCNNRRSVRLKRNIRTSLLANATTRPWGVHTPPPHDLTTACHYWLGLVCMNERVAQSSCHILRRKVADQPNVTRPHVHNSSFLRLMEGLHRCKASSILHLRHRCLVELEPGEQEMLRSLIDRYWIMHHEFGQFQGSDGLRVLGEPAEAHSQ